MAGGPYPDRPMATLVTGGAGLVGSHVARLLVERGDDVRLVVRSTTRLDNVIELEAQRVVADLHDGPALRRALRGVDRIFHAAGLTNFRATPAQLWHANVEATRVVLEEALRADL